MPRWMVLDTFERVRHGSRVGLCVCIQTAHTERVAAGEVSPRGDPNAECVQSRCDCSLLRGPAPTATHLCHVMMQHGCQASSQMSHRHKMTDLIGN